MYSFSNKTEDEALDNMFLCFLKTAVILTVPEKRLTAYLSIYETIFWHRSLHILCFLYMRAPLFRVKRLEQATS